MKEVKAAQEQEQEQDQDQEVSAVQHFTHPGKLHDSRAGQCTCPPVVSHAGAPQEQEQEQEQDQERQEHSTEGTAAQEQEQEQEQEPSHEGAVPEWRGLPAAGATYPSPQECRGRQEEER